MSPLNRTCCQYLPYSRLVAGNAAFSLVELLTVLAILGVVSASLLPAFTSIGTANRLASGAASVSSGLAIARAHAIATRNLTRFVVVSNWPGHPEANYSKFGIWHFVEGETATSGTWVQVSKWEALPEGIAFDPTPAKAYLASAESIKNNPQAIQGPDILGSAVTEADFTSGTATFKGRFVEFAPKGSVRSASSGEPAVWFTVTEAVMDGGALRYTRGGASPNNWCQISIGTLLGRATVYVP